MRYGGSKLKKPEKCECYGIFYHLNGVWRYTQKSDKKGLSQCTQKLYFRFQKYFGFGLWGYSAFICVHLRL